MSRRIVVRAKKSRECADCGGPSVCVIPLDLVSKHDFVRWMILKIGWLSVFSLLTFAIRAGALEKVELVQFSVERDTAMLLSR